MRKLMWFTLGFTAACGLYAYGMGKLWIPLEGLLTSVLLVLLALLFRRRRCLLPALGILAGCTIGIYWFLGFDILPHSFAFQILQQKDLVSQPLLQYCNRHHELNQILLFCVLAQFLAQHLEPLPVL